MQFDSFHDAPVDPVVGLVLASVHTVGEALITDDLQPLPSQYGMKQGDFAILPGTAAQVDQSITVVELLNPEEHSDEYPDWEERVLNSYVLCKIIDEEDAVGTTGWVSRVKLIQLTPEQYEFILGFLVSGEKPPELPDWLDDAYNNYQRELSEVTGQVPGPVQCGNCGKYTVVLHVTHTTELTCEVGQVPKQENVFAIMDGNNNHHCTTVVKMICGSCRSATKPLDHHQLKVDPNSTVAGMISHSH